WRRRRAPLRSRCRVHDDRRGPAVFRGDGPVYAQVVVDTTGKAVLAVSPLSPELRGQLQKTADVPAAKQVGLLAARRCLEKGIKRVVFDRNGFLYHGRIRAVAEGAREGGLEF